MREHMTVAATLPEDGAAGALAGRIWRPDVNGPAVICVREDGVYDITEHAPTASVLAEIENPLVILRDSKAERVGDLADILANTPAADRDPSRPWLLSPVDLQAVKAAGTTFIRPLLDGLVSPREDAAPYKTEAIRTEINARFDSPMAKLVPGSEQALALRAALIEQDLWTCDLEAGLGEHAEIFTKAQPMSTVGHGMEAGLHPHSALNNPEPEVVLVISSSGRIAGVTLGNDITSRDFTARSALFLSKIKDNNASAAIGPFIRFFDNFFSLEAVRRMEITLKVRGIDGFDLESSFSMAEMSRDPEALINDMMGGTHQYPDGVVLYLGTAFTPIQDRNKAGAGFTHNTGDIVTISTPALGSLTNLITTSDSAEPWVFGIGALMRNLTARGLVS